MQTPTTEFLVTAPPPTRPPRRVVEGMALRWKRVILHEPTQWVYDVRAAGNPHRDDDGELCVPVMTEQDYYRYRFVEGFVPEVVTYPANLVWVE